MPDIDYATPDEEQVVIMYCLSYDRTLRTNATISTTHVVQYSLIWRTTFSRYLKACADKDCANAKFEKAEMKPALLEWVYAGPRT
jgi:hypothetical protein